MPNVAFPLDLSVLLRVHDAVTMILKDRKEPTHLKPIFLNFSYSEISCPETELSLSSWEQ